MTIGTHKLTLSPSMLQRGFWLYVWRVVAPDGQEFAGDATSSGRHPRACPEDLPRREEAALPNRQRDGGTCVTPGGTRSSGQARG